MINNTAYLIAKTFLFWRYRMAVVVLSLFSSHSSHCQSTLFQNYSHEDNLISNAIYDLYQDKYNKLWIATEMGVFCYDGLEFQSIRLNGKEFIEPILQFFPQPSGELLACSMNEVFIVNVKRRELWPHKNNKVIKSASTELSIEDLYVTENGDLLLSYMLGHGVARISKDGKLLSRPSKESPSRPSVLVYKDGNDELFHYRSIDTLAHFKSSVFKLDSTAGNLSYFKLFEQGNVQLAITWDKVYLLKNWHIQFTIKQNHRPLRAGIINDSYIWVGYLGGGFELFDFQGNSISNYLKGKSVTNILLDSENNYWISTLNNGLFRSTSIFTKHFEFEKYGNVVSISRGIKESINFVTSRGEVLKFKGNEINLIHTSEKTQNSLVGIFGDNEFVVSDISILSIGDRKIDVGEYVRNISEENKDFVLLTGKYAIVEYKKDRLSKYATSGFNTDACYFKKGLYVGKKEGVYLYDKGNSTERKLPIKGLNSTVSDLEPTESNLYIATKGSGLFIYSNSYRQLTEENGLSSNFINDVYIQNDTVIWICTSRGLDRIAYSGNGVLSINTLNKSHGLASDDILDVELFNDTLWVVNSIGVGAIPIADIKFNQIKNSYPLILTRVLVNESSNFDKDKLSYNQNNIQIKFEAVSLKNKSTVSYRYKLRKTDPNWQYTNVGNINLGSLSPGSYQVLIQAIVEGNPQSNPIEYSFVIYPPYYKSWWFVASIIFVAVILVYLFFRFRILSYNRDVIRAILRNILKRLNKRSMTFSIRQQGEIISINSRDVLFAKSLGNYLQIKTINDQFVIRHKISNFIQLVPDPIEYVQVRKSHIVRIDQIAKYSSKTITVGDEEIVIGRVFKKSVDEVLEFIEQ